jgi:predicted PurR-regulated permease PerM
LALTTKTGSLFSVVVVAAVLYLARDVLIPLALAILLSFLLAPAVRALEHWRLGRMVATLAAVAIAFSAIAGVGYVAARQALSLAAKLPEYRENIQKKIRSVRAPDDGALGKAAEAIKELESEAAPEAAAPLPVTETPPSAYAALAEWVEPFAKPVATAVAVVVFTILMLLNRESMRERLIGLIGPGQINVATRALGEASSRVSNYLYMLLLVNAAFGIPFGIALYFIGIPNALLWGLLGTLLRFIPYAGVWLAAALPTVLAFAIFDGWGEVAWVLGVFIVLELLLVNAVEPWLYGRSAGLSAIAVIAAALFWTWLWGPVGLLLAVPLTVCMAVVGRYVPELGYLNVLLGVEPVLTPEARYYQRLIARDAEEAAELAEEYAKEHGTAALYDNILVPALTLAETDRHKGALEPERERFVLQTTREIIEPLEEEAPPAPAGAAAVAIIAAHDDADGLAADMLARLLRRQQVAADVLSADSLAAETLERIGSGAYRIVCISAVPPRAGAHAARLARRLKKAFPQLRVAVALWTSESVDKVRPRLLAAGADEVLTRVEAAAAYLHQLAPS